MPALRIRAVQLPVLAAGPNSFARTAVKTQADYDDPLVAAVGAQLRDYLQNAVEMR